MEANHACAPGYVRFDLYLWRQPTDMRPARCLLAGPLAGWRFILWADGCGGRLSLIVQRWSVRIQVGPLILTRDLGVLA